MENKNVVKGFKVFNSDWTCRSFKFEVGKTFAEDVTPVCCDRGFHFCTKAADCFKYYNFDPDNKVAEVEALGDIDTNNDDSKCCTNKIKIVREITWQEVLELVNLGKACTGFSNSGDYNSGDCNSGNRNSGNYNSGDCNSGDCNSGNRNSGNCNSGNRNSGDYNKSSFNNGCFMTIEPKIMMFNKQSDWTFMDWIKSEARNLLNIQTNVLEWIYEEDMTKEEKAANPTYKTTCGYLKVLEESECCQLWWDGLCERNRDIIRSMPNFDAEIFEEVTGIKVD